MDMQLVPRYAEQAALRACRCPGVQQNVGIRTAVVEVSQLTDPLRNGHLTWICDGSRWSVRVDRSSSATRQGAFESVRRVTAATVLAPAWK